MKKNVPIKLHYQQVSSTSDPVTERTTGDQFPSDLRYFDDDDVEAARLAGRDINFLLLDGLPMLGTKRHALPPNQPSACIPTTAGSSLSASEPHEPAVTHTPSSIDRLEKIGNAERKTFIGLLSMLKTSKASTPPTKSASYCQ